MAAFVSQKLCTKKFREAMTAEEIYVWIAKKVDFFKKTNNLPVEHNVSFQEYFIPSCPVYTPLTVEDEKCLIPEKDWLAQYGNLGGCGSQKKKHELTEIKAKNLEAQPIEPPRSPEKEDEKVDFILYLNFHLIFILWLFRSICISLTPEKEVIVMICPKLASQILSNLILNSPLFRYLQFI